MAIKFVLAYRTIGTIANVAIRRALTGQMYRSESFSHSPEQIVLRK